jgi:hypothetical protein
MHDAVFLKVNAAIEAFVQSRSICTLYDLERALLEYSVEKKDSFESLRLGPLQCLPIVYDKFKFPQECKIPEITTADVLEVQIFFSLQFFFFRRALMRWTNYAQVKNNNR